MLVGNVVDLPPHVSVNFALCIQEHNHFVRILRRRVQESFTCLDCYALCKTVARVVPCRPKIGGCRRRRMLTWVIRVVVEYSCCWWSFLWTANDACGDPIVSARVLICLEKHGISFSGVYEEIPHSEWFNVVSIGFDYLSSYVPEVQFHS